MKSLAGVTARKCLGLYPQLTLPNSKLHAAPRVHTAVPHTRMLSSGSEWGSTLCSPSHALWQGLHLPGGGGLCGLAPMLHTDQHQPSSPPLSYAKRMTTLAMTMIVVENSECDFGCVSRCQWWRTGRGVYFVNIRKRGDVEFHML